MEEQTIYDEYFQLVKLEKEFCAKVHTECLVVLAQSDGSFRTILVSDDELALGVGNLELIRVEKGEIVFYTVEDFRVVWQCLNYHNAAKIHEYIVRKVYGGNMLTGYR
jgi:hypothetical protein